MKLPETCKMPDISKLRKPLVMKMLLKVLIGQLSDKNNLENYYKNFIRLIDKAVTEYMKARETIMEEIDIFKSAKPIQERRLFLNFKFIDHMENCINALRRAIKLFEKIYPKAKVERNLRKLIQSLSKEVIDIRDTLEHMDEKDGSGPIMIAVTDDATGIFLLEYSISFERLARIIRKLYELAQTAILK